VSSDSVAPYDSLMQSGQPQRGSDEGREPHRAVRRAEVFDRVGNPLPTSCSNGVPLQEISDTVGHKSTHVTETVYRHVIVPAIRGGATVMDSVFGDADGETGTAAVVPTTVTT
jgi:hypothetical protein